METHILYETGNEWYTGITVNIPKYQHPSIFNFNFQIIFANVGRLQPSPQNIILQTRKYFLFQWALLLHLYGARPRARTRRRWRRYTLHSHTLLSLHQCYTK
jgi:hypothetical protein